jgi:hypothetical protein
MAMQRARRLASVVVVASLGVAGLSGCQQAPGVAAYLGSLGNITESRVQAVWDNARDALPPQQRATMTVTRTDVVRTLLLAKVFDQVAADYGLTANTDQLDQIATSAKLPASTQFVQLYAHWASLFLQLKTAAESAPEPGEADLKTVYDGLHSNAVIPATETYDQFKASLASSADNDRLLRSGVASQAEIERVTGPLHIKVSPRYQPMTPLSLLSITTANGASKDLISVPLGNNGSAAPVDAAAS